MIPKISKCLITFRTDLPHSFFIRMEIFIVWCKLIRKFPDSSLILILLTFLEKFHLCAWNWRYLLPIGCFTNNVGLLFLLLRLEKAILLGLLLNGTYFNNYFFVIIILVPALEFLRCCWIIKPIGRRCANTKIGWPPPPVPGLFFISYALY